MSEADFADLERQLNEIASYGTISATSGSSLTPSNAKSDGNSAQLHQAQLELSKLQQELDQAKLETKEANKKANLYQEKLHQMVEGVKEERNLQKQNEDELSKKLEAAESRADSMEEKLVKLVEIVKKDRLNREGGTTNPANQVQVQELTKKNSELQQEIQTLHGQVGTLEGDILNREANQMESVELLERLNKQLKEVQQKLMQTEQKLAQADQNAEEAKSAFNMQINTIEGRLRQSQETEKFLKNELVVANSKAVPNTNSNDLQERLDQAEATSREYESKINKLVAAVKTERTTVKQKLDDAVLKAKVESEKVAKLEAEVARLEHQIANKVNSPVYTQAESESTPIEDSPSFSGGPPPPPPPAPTIKIIDSTKLTIIKSGNNLVEKPKDKNAESMTNLIAAIRSGVKLKAVEKTVVASPPKSEGVDFGALAQEIAKSRQRRMANQNQQRPANARKSVALSNLLKELDELK